MRNLKILILSIMLILPVANICLANDLPGRYANGVLDVYNAYYTDEWIIKPTEEPQGDIKAESPEECDIKGVISCYDEENLRIDILLYNSIVYKQKIFYVLSFEYTNMEEYYIYYPTTNECFYGVKTDGKIINTQIIDQKSSGDRMSVTTASKNKNDDVFFVLNKSNHIEGPKGKRYFLTAQFLSGYTNANGELIFVDQTPKINLFFKK